ncbi:glutathione-dependent formaldehyde dehydrogenase, partial [Pseudomonas sp. NPDC078863]
EAIITHRLPLEQAARGYELFDKAEEECRKVILLPGGSDRPLTEPVDELTPELRVQGVPGF